MATLSSGYQTHNQRRRNSTSSQRRYRSQQPSNNRNKNQSASVPNNLGKGVLPKQPNDQARGNFSDMERTVSVSSDQSLENTYPPPPVPLPPIADYTEDTERKEQKKSGIHNTDITPPPLDDGDDGGNLSFADKSRRFRLAATRMKDAARAQHRWSWMSRKKPSQDITNKKLETQVAYACEVIKGDNDLRAFLMYISPFDDSSLELSREEGIAKIV
ncbi:MAG: hypothetical protein HRT90_05910 [Candidatus Margulisbacteria bacterium]|nr:hypothetical protein [Candidatus Margulisiibacteriota bacterium]